MIWHSLALKFSKQFKWKILHVDPMNGSAHALHIATETFLITSLVAFIILVYSMCISFFSCSRQLLSTMLAVKVDVSSLLQPFCVYKNCFFCTLYTMQSVWYVLNESRKSFRRNNVEDEKSTNNHWLCDVLSPIPLPSLSFSVLMQSICRKIEPFSRKGKSIKFDDCYFDSILVAMCTHGK